ncbi:BEL1-like homeodomain protein 9 [Tripterygium wilfordii]|uniref:BEL1-like homeodomain protein 9 n=1 Tax=Tripterygium wilfordii TaxID=458696 RepID=A0A7J7DX00_TRIWF|nr:BEL1-like homeodomain protein 9 [Tripterygium wilfordii]KAF5750902.1 BEL1-like homeodomain protein 9 [Tripterygium wilfordii]
MAEGFEPYHVPQQSRRDKLRVLAQNHSGTGCVDSSLIPFYDPSLLSSDLLTCANNHSTAGPPVGILKEGGVSGNLMGFVSSTSQHHHPYLDPQSSLSINPYFYPSHQNFQNLRSNYDHQSYNGHGGDQDVLYKPEPLSLTHQECNSTSTGQGQGLSLSLSSHHTHHSNLPLELNYMVPTGIAGCGGGGGSGSTSNEVSRSSVPLGPFTGYSSILKGSRFLKPAQQLMEELCDVGRAIYAEKIAPDSALIEPSMDSLNASGDLLSCVDGSENRRTKSRLLAMLDEVYRRYKQYYQQMQAVVASFEYVAGLSNAAPYANLALKALSKHFRSLKNAITDHLQFNNKAQGPMSHGRDEAPRFGNSERGIYDQRPVHSSGSYDQQPVWRPQRGLPERAVSVLRAWLFEHFLHPYPMDKDKLMLAKQTGLTRSQVSNWFINARVRLWKPMVEEIHMLETRQAQKALQRDERNANRLTDNSIASSNLLVSENPSTSTQRIHGNPPSKHSRDDLRPIPVGSDQEALNLSYHNLSSHQQHMGVGVGMAGGSGVSLTLGLHQNNGIGLSESYPINAAQRFGLEGSNEGYVMANFEVQNRHFGRGVIGGQLLRDFVG